MTDCNPSEDHISADRKVLERLVCPVTKESLVYNRDSNELISKKAQLAYPVRYGIPIMLVDEARELSDEDLS
ncbi:Trm112 family protein [Temperatibacter marinus]|uniref:UPF0434 protein QGN29_04340 n=1 Tax=Temperatibacter marinus TaxID=1456591 RepID=A0AA52EF12_9PROT|nr:Trm112 family protein [Temperatibacter marinus]WND03601.1 Trm112 family protein [Temperatibacter marinus]